MSHSLSRWKFEIQALAIATPVALQLLTTSLTGFIDALMIGRLGEVSLVGVGFANQISFIVLMSFFGLHSGIGTHISQYWGKRDNGNMKSCVALSLTLSLIGGLIFFIVIRLFSLPILQLFTNEAQPLSEGNKYLRLLSISYVFSALSFSLAISSRSIGQSRLPFLASLPAALIKVLLSWCLVFGKLGFPELKVEGAAIATIIARIVECLTLFVFLRVGDSPINPSLASFGTLNRVIFWKVIRTSFPVLLNELLWALGILVYHIAYAQCGTAQYAALQIAISVNQIFMVVPVGVGASCAAIIGKALGRGNLRRAKIFAWKFIRLGMVLSTILGVFTTLISVPITWAYEVSNEVKSATTATLLIFAIVIYLQMTTTILITGIFRGGGDTKFAFILETACVYLIGIPLAFLGLHLLKLQIFWLLALVFFEDVVKNIIGLYRVASGKWAKSLVSNTA